MPRLWGIAVRKLPNRKSKGLVISWTWTQSRFYGDSKRVGVDPLTSSILKWFDGSLDVGATCNRKSIFICLQFCPTECVWSQVNSRLLSRATCYSSIRATLSFLLPTKILQLLLTKSSPLSSVLALLFCCFGVTGRQNSFRQPTWSACDSRAQLLVASLNNIPVDKYRRHFGPLFFATFQSPRRTLWDWLVPLLV
jgi:hypothetical protein